MKSSTGQYYVGLDHIRAFAAFIVFVWHFIHVNDQHLASASFPPFAILTEGHTGVSLFMTLSGYLFAKILNGRQVHYFGFLWNRFLRLAPLLLFVIVIVGVTNYWNGASMEGYAERIFSGFIMPGWPNGGWSITIELHFYVILPLLLFFSNRSLGWLPIFLLIAIIFRYFIFIINGEVQSFAYWTILGRIDQFIIGILAFQYFKFIQGKHLAIAAISFSFVMFYSWFEFNGGFYKFPSYPSPSPIWVLMPTIEAFAYATFIAWYDSSFKHSTSKASTVFASIGTYSYSIYLLHFFFYSKMANFVDDWIFEISNVYIGLIFAVPNFFLMVPIAYLSFRFIEAPFLRFRTSYFKHTEQDKLNDSTKL